MSLYALLLVALGMSMDAFAVALAKGAAVRMPRAKLQQRLWCSVRLKRSCRWRAG